MKVVTRVLKMTTKKDEFIYVATPTLGVTKFKVVDIQHNGTLVGIDQDGFKMSFSSRFPPNFHKTEKEAIICAYKKESAHLLEIKESYEKKLNKIQKDIDKLNDKFSYLIDENPEEFI